MVQAHGAGAALRFEVGDEGLGLRFFDGVEDAVDREQRDDGGGAVDEHQRNVDPRVKGITEHHDRAAPDPVAQPASEWRGNHAGDVEEGVQQHHLLHVKAGLMRLEQQEAEAVIGQCENAGR